MRVTPVDLERHRDVVYIIGEACPDWLPPHDFLIYQNALPAHDTLPARPRPPVGPLYGIGGHHVQRGGKALPVWQGRWSRRARRRPDWWIMSRIAERMGKRRMGYGAMEAVQGEIRKYIRAFPEMKERIAFTAFAWEDGARRQAVSSGSPARGGSGDVPFLLYCKAELDAYRGLPLADLVPGMKQIGNRGCLMINTDDAERLGLAENGLVDVGSDGLALRFPVRVSAAVCAGTVHLIAGGESPFLTNPCRSG